MREERVNAFVKSDACLWRSYDARHKTALQHRAVETYSHLVNAESRSVNGLNIDNPKHDKALRQHMGYHPRMDLDCAQGSHAHEYNALAGSLGLSSFEAFPKDRHVD